jgi:hypothetical protein
MEYIQPFIILYMKIFIKEIYQENQRILSYKAAIFQFYV